MVDVLFVRVIENIKFFMMDVVFEKEFYINYLVNEM